MMHLHESVVADAVPVPGTAGPAAARRTLFDAVCACAEALQRQLHDAATPQSLRRTIGRFALAARTLPIPPERVIAAFTFMLDGVLDTRWAPVQREEVRLALMRIAIEEYYGVRLDDARLR